MCIVWCLMSVGRNAALSALVGGIADTVSALTLSGASPVATPPAAPPTGAAAGDSAGGGGRRDHRMDVQDFVE